MKILKLLKILSILLVVIYPASTIAKVKLPNLISNHMVLQQKTKVLLWGLAGANKKVKVFTSWNKSKYMANSDASGNWKLEVATPAAGGPYYITFEEGEKTQIDNVLIGEVWVCSGQSNMDMPVKGYKNQPVLNANELLADAGNDQVRMFKVTRGLSREPLNDVDAKWLDDSASNVKDFSAVGYQFAKMLHRKLKVPIGIIQSTWGGTNITGWMNTNSLGSFPEIKSAPITGQQKMSTREPSALFNAMINPLLNYKINGVLWYQGEANRNRPGNYAQLMTAMVKAWRQQWNSGEWPFYYVQIAPFNYTSNENLVPYLQEAQYKAMSMIPNSGMVVSVDAGSKGTIHPPDKTVISQRLAYWALSKHYGKTGIANEGPVYKSHSFKNGTVNLVFDHAENGLTSNSEQITGFEVAGDDHLFYPAKAKITGTGLVVSSDKVARPVAVRYCFKAWVQGNVYNSFGLPLAPFRTDDLPASL